MSASPDAQRRNGPPGPSAGNGRPVLMMAGHKTKQGVHPMKKLYKYTGTVSGFSYRRNNPNALPFLDLVLCDLSDDDKAPIRIEALGGLADYINAIEGTDAEERYLTADWYFDSLLYLHRIEIPSTEPWRPAKIIAQHDAIEPTATIFGPADYIKEPKPGPMDSEQYHAWCAYNYEDEYRYTARKADA